MLPVHSTDSSTVHAACLIPRYLIHIQHLYPTFNSHRDYAEGMLRGWWARATTTIIQKGILLSLLFTTIYPPFALRDEAGETQHDRTATKF